MLQLHQAVALYVLTCLKSKLLFSYNYTQFYTLHAMLWRLESLFAVAAFALRKSSTFFEQIYETILYLGSVTTAKALTL